MKNDVDALIRMSVPAADLASHLVAQTNQKTRNKIDSQVVSGGTGTAKTSSNSRPKFNNFKEALNWAKGRVDAQGITPGPMFPQSG